jgi:hypothetical protein
MFALLLAAHTMTSKENTMTSEEKKEKEAQSSNSFDRRRRRRRTDQRSFPLFDIWPGRRRRPRTH